MNSIKLLFISLIIPLALYAQDYSGYTEIECDLIVRSRHPDSHPQTKTLASVSPIIAKIRYKMIINFEIVWENGTSYAIILDPLNIFCQMN